jgi:two-component system cell cycle sensor histidine kinase/response regulator CckA
MESNGKSHDRRAASPQGAASILLVDDDDSVRASLVALLRARGADVAAAADGQAAIQLFQERADEIDAVVLDQNMPAMNGTSVLRELRAIRPDIKVVISSGGLIEPWNEQVDGCNRLAFAQKALGPHELISQLERLLERKL